MSCKQHSLIPRPHPRGGWGMRLHTLRVREGYKLDDPYVHEFEHAQLNSSSKINVAEGAGSQAYLL